MCNWELLVSDWDNIPRTGNCPQNRLRFLFPLRGNGAHWAGCMASDIELFGFRMVECLMGRRTTAPDSPKTPDPKKS